MTVRKKVDDWIYKYFDLKTPACEFDKFEQIVNLLSLKRNGDALSSWYDFDFYEMVQKICIYPEYLGVSHGPDVIISDTIP